MAAAAGDSVVFTSILSPRPAHTCGLSVLKNSLLFKIAGGEEGGSDGGTNQSVTAVTYRCLPLCVKKGGFRLSHTSMTLPSQKRGRCRPRMQSAEVCRDPCRRRRHPWRHRESYQAVNPTWICYPPHAIWQRACPDSSDGPQPAQGRSHGCGEVRSHATPESGGQMRRLPSRIEAGEAAEGFTRSLYRLPSQPRHSARHPRQGRGGGQNAPFAPARQRRKSRGSLHKRLYPIPIQPPPLRRSPPSC